MPNKLTLDIVKKFSKRKSYGLHGLISPIVPKSAHSDRRRANENRNKNLVSISKFRPE